MGVLPSYTSSCFPAGNLDVRPKVFYLYFLPYEPPAAALVDVETGVGGGQAPPTQTLASCGQVFA